MNGYTLVTDSGRLANDCRFMKDSTAVARCKGGPPSCFGRCPHRGCTGLQVNAMCCAMLFYFISDGLLCLELVSNESWQG
jgi:hypothetical protein